MISNGKQYTLTKKSIEDLENSLKSLSGVELVKAGIDPVIANAHRNSIQARLEELREEVGAYELLTSGLRELDLDSFEDLGRKLVAARVANGWTQKELAERLGVKEQQVQRYEKERYSSASLDRLVDVSRVLGLRITGRVERGIDDAALPSRHIKNLLYDLDVSCFPLAEMRKRGWIKYDSASVRSEEGKRELLISYFADCGLKYVSPMLNKRANRHLTTKAVCSLLAWQAHVRHEATHSRWDIAKFSSIDLALLKEIVSFTVLDDGPTRAIDLLRNSGIRVIIEPHLGGSLLDGASMLLEDGSPVIGLTLREDRLDNFWFVLFHELGHVAKHRYSGLAEGFLDQKIEETEDKREQEANEFARNALIPEEVWKRSFVRYSTSEADIVGFAKNLGVGPEVVAGRLRFERGDYAIFNRLVGRRKVKKLFGM